MKSSKLFFGIFLFMFTIGGAFGITRCIPVPQTCSNATGGDGKLDWAAKCSLSGGGSYKVTGVAVCAENPGSMVGDVAESVSVSANSTDNRYCWCLMTSPVLSKYLYSGDQYGVGSCMYYCATNCGTNMGTKSYRQKTFENLDAMYSL